MNVSVYIDTTSNQKIKVGLIVDEQEYLIDQELTRQKAQVVLPLIENLLREHELSLGDIKQITVNPGPGSFTGVRVGLSVANTLGFLLKVSVNQQPMGMILEPIY